MKRGLRWTVLAIVALVSLSATSAWAIWNPDTDANLLFNLNFETYNNPAHTTTSVDPPPPQYSSLVGTVEDYNATYPNIFGETSRAGLGVDANFEAIHDIATGAGIETVDGVQVSSPNDVKVTVDSNAVFELGYPTRVNTWAFWFNVPNLNFGTIVRHASLYLAYTGYENLIWEVRIDGGKMSFYHKNNSLRMETASSLEELGIDVNNWHHAALVLDRSNSVETTVPTTQLSTKIYIDGLEVPVIITSLNDTDMSIDAYPYYDSPVWFGAGQREFDGLLDDVRLYNRALTALEVSILNQPDATVPRALLPIPRSSSVVMSTGLSWEPATGSTSQVVYFGTDSSNLAQVKTGDGSLNTVTNAELGGTLAINTKYYWYVKYNGSNGPLWWFTTETGKAISPTPIDGASDINNADINLMWNTPTAATYSVYASTNRSLVDSCDVSVRIVDSNTNPYIIGFDPCSIGSRGATIYWKVNCTYPVIGTVSGDIWSFRTKPYELVFNTSGSVTTYADHVFSAYACELHGDGWSSVATGSLASDGVAVFDFASGFDYNDKYDIIVIPALRARDIRVSEGNVPQPLAIHATGNFYFDGRIQLAGDDILTTTQDTTRARSGGFPGPKHNQDSSIFGDSAVPGDSNIAAYWTAYNVPANGHTRFGLIASQKYIYVPTDLAKSTFGPGQPINPPYKGSSGGGGSGGAGGEGGRGYWYGVSSGGPSYGDKEVPVPFGGSSGGWGGGTGTPGGAAGGGGIEIVATGNVTLDSNSQIRAWGGSQNCSPSPYPAGGGGGGCVRIIATGSVTTKGIINVNGGTGGRGNRVDTAGAKSTDTAGGGGGGRVAIFYGTTYTPGGTITANGGVKGMNGGRALAQNGDNGTIFTSNGSPKKASAPTPLNGDKMVYCNPDPCTGIQLKWYSGYGGGTDEVFCDTNPNPTTSRGTATASRGQHSVTMPSVSSGNTYYWKVATDGAVSSDTWSFRTVNWRCRQYDGNEPNNLHTGGPEWDSNHDCVLNFADFWYFAKDWFNPVFGDNMLDHTYVGNNPPTDNMVSDLGRFAREWLECYNRTDNGCAGY